MDPNVRSMFDKVLKRLDDLRSDSGGRWERWERRFEEATTAQHERDAAIESHVQSLEDYAASQYNAAAVADNWGARFDERFSDVEQRMTEIERIRIHEINDERDDRVAAVESAISDLNLWRPGVEGMLDELHWQIRRGRPVRGGAAMESPTPGTHRQHESVAARSPAGRTIDWPKGHDFDMTTREMGGDVFSHPTRIPADGTFQVPDPPPAPNFRSRPPPPPNPTFTVADSHPNFAQNLPPQPNSPSFHHHNASLGQLPKMHFPQFDGSTPQLWITQAHSYFDMYMVEQSMWVRVASMQFVGVGKRWIQTIAHRLDKLCWTEFCILLRERFCRDQC